MGGDAACSHITLDNVVSVGLTFLLLIGEVLAWLDVWSEVQMICVWYS